jgi:superfamily II DNA or RNA helicase
MSVAAGAPALRAWQAEALESWCGHGRHGVVEAVTGTGKSRVGIEAAREALTDDYNVVIVVPTVDLVSQWVRVLKRNHVPSVGASGDGQKATFATHRVIVGTVQSLYRDPPTRPDGKVLLVADECHRYGAGQWSRALHSSYRRRLGLTATFERNDDGINQLLAYFGGSPVYRINFRRAIADGVVAPYDVKILGVELNAAERRAYDRADEIARDARLQLLAADFPAEPFGAFLHEVQRAADDDPDPTISDLARRYLKAFSERIDIMTNAQAKLEATKLLAPAVEESRGSIVFTRRVDMSEEIASTLVESGVKAAAVHSETPRATRQDMLTHLKIGRLKALVAPTILDEGLDVPDIDLGIVMGGSRSRRQMIQRMGRVLRLKEDGRKATFIVVYAKNTAEDITRTDGAEGCLDLIVESANTVTHLVANGNRLSPDTGAVPPLPREVPPQQTNRDESAVNHQPIDSDPAAVLTEIDPSELPMTRRAVNDYRTAHGTDDREAEQALRLILADFKHRTKPRWWPPVSGAIVLRHCGFQLVVCRDRFIGYVSARPDALMWIDVRDAQETRVAETQASSPEGEVGPAHPLATAQPLPRPVAVDSTSAVIDQKLTEAPVAIDPTTVMFDSRVGRVARSLFNPTLSLPDVEDKLRQALAADLAAQPDLKPSGHLFEIVGSKGTWTVRGDGRVVHHFRLHSATTKTAQPSRRVPESKPKANAFNIGLLETKPEMLHEFLDPTTATVELPAMAKAARALGLGDSESDESLLAVRSLLSDDTTERPDITSAFGRITVHGRRATWTLRGRDLSVISIDVKARRPDATSEGSPPGAESEEVAQPAAMPMVAQEEAPDESVGASDECVESGAIGPESTLSESPTPAIAPEPASDLVSQIERLAALKQRGLLTDSEFAAAKAKLLA